jgi:hypothetical protein
MQYICPFSLSRIYNSKTLMMATAGYIDESCSEVIDPPKTEVLDVTELAGDHVQHPPKPNVVVSSSVRELLECPVCLSAMYPPIHQVRVHTDPLHDFIYVCVKLTLFNVSRLDGN